MRLMKINDRNPYRTRSFPVTARVFITALLLTVILSALPCLAIEVDEDDSEAVRAYYLAEIDSEVADVVTAIRTAMDNGVSFEDCLFAIKPILDLFYSETMPGEISGKGNAEHVIELEAGEHILNVKCEQDDVEAGFMAVLKDSDGDPVDIIAYEKGSFETGRPIIITGTGAYTIEISCPDDCEWRIWWE